MSDDTTAAGQPGELPQTAAAFDADGGTDAEFDLLSAAAPDHPDGDASGDREVTGSGPGGDASAEDDLAEALEGLSQLAVADQSLESSLTWIATLAVLAIPSAQGAGLTMFEAAHPQTVCVSHQFVQQVDDVQYSLGEGPCVDAAATGVTVMSGSLGSDARWPRFAPRMRDLGVASVVSLPLVMAGGEVMGAMNVYAHDPDSFDADSARHGAVFATAATVVVHNARGMMQANRLAEQLRTALTSRATIDQAIGIVMSRQGSTPDDAFAALKRLSQTQNVKLAEVAERIVREAVLRARARHAGGQSSA